MPLEDARREKVVFADRADAGQRLAGLLTQFRATNAVVVGLPRGGVVVAAEVAAALALPLDVLPVRKLGVPGNPELAMGAVSAGGTRFINERTVAMFGVGPRGVREAEEYERQVLDARTHRWERHGERVDLHGRTVIVVDDGIATGATAIVACQRARVLGAIRIIVAAPVAPEESRVPLSDADEVICIARPHNFWAVGNHYRDFRQTDDEEVASLLDQAAARI